MYDWLEIIEGKTGYWVIGYIKVFGGPFTDAKFKTDGCGSAIASSSLMTEWVKGRTIDDAESIKNVEIAKELCLPPVKIHCSILAEDAIKAAVQNYKDKTNDVKVRIEKLN